MKNPTPPNPGVTATAAAPTITMKTYHNKKSVKTKYVNRVKNHRLADELIKGIGWSNGKGCAIGCTLENYDYTRFPIELGLPEWLARLEDHIFEFLPNAQAQLWPEQLLSAIPVGISEAKLAIVRDKFLIFWLRRQLKQFDRVKFAPVETAIQTVIKLFSQAMKGVEPQSAAWSAAQSAAWSAAAWSAAAWSAARSAAAAARSAAWSAARSAAAAARSAAWSAAAAAQNAAAEQEATVKRDWLLRAFRNLKN